MGNISKYTILTIKHKWFVFLAGLKTGAPIWRLIIHDWTKLMPVELPHYGRQFFGDANDPEGFIRCWTHHQNSHPHHWEYWIPRTGHNRCTPPFKDNEPLRMPSWAVREMVADWMGASRAYTGEWPIPVPETRILTSGLQHWPWLKENYIAIKKRIHPDTHRGIEIVMNELRFSLPEEEQDY